MKALVRDLRNGDKKLCLLGKCHTGDMLVCTKQASFFVEKFGFMHNPPAIHSKDGETNYYQNSLTMNQNYYKTQEWYKNKPDWWSIDPNYASDFYKTKSEAAEIREFSGERRGHHPYGLAFGERKG